MRWHPHVSAASPRAANSVNYVLKHNLILNPSMDALLAKRLIMSDSVKSSAGLWGVEKSQIAFPQPSMPGWCRQLGIKTL